MSSVLSPRACRAAVGGGGGVDTRLVGAEARLDDEDVHVGEDGDAHQTDDNRKEVVKERRQGGSKHGGAAAERLPNECDRDCGAGNGCRHRRDHGTAQAIAQEGCDGEEAEPQDEGEDIHRGERSEPLVALQYAHRDGERQCRDQRRLGDHDDADRVDVEHAGERDGQHERERNEGSGREQGKPERGPDERVGSLYVSCSLPAGDLA